MESAEHYRQRAVELRAQAAEAKTAYIKEQFLLLAAQYEEMAKDREGHSRF
jgi:hypothetical protein